MGQDFIFLKVICIFKIVSTNSLKSQIIPIAHINVLELNTSLSDYLYLDICM